MSGRRWWAALLLALSGAACSSGGEGGAGGTAGGSGGAGGGAGGLATGGADAGVDAPTAPAEAGPFTLVGPAFEADGTMPVKYSCDGEGVSPPFTWSGTPAGTVELALIMSTLANDGVRWNWVLYHIPGATTELAEGAPVGTAGLTSDGPLLAYYPPCSQGPGAKTYTFTLYALSAIPTFSVPPEEVTAPVLSLAIAQATLGTAALDVSYTRQ